MTKKIPTPPSLEKLKIKVLNATNHPCYGMVEEHVKHHDESIADQEDGKTLGWIIETFEFNDEQLMADPKRVETACRVFEAIVFAFRLDENRTSIRGDADFSMITGWVHETIIADTDIHGNHDYRESLRKALDIADGILAEVKALRPILDEIESWMIGGGWGDAVKAVDTKAHAVITSYLDKDQQERDKSLVDTGERRFLARQSKNVIWLIFKNGHDFFDNESAELREPFEAAFKDHGVTLPSSRSKQVKPLSGKPRVKKPGSASKRKPLVLGSDGKPIRRHTPAEEARKKSKRG